MPTGKVSSYIFSLRPGDKVNVSGPFGHFFAKDSDAEMVFIGGGAGMAPMRAIIFDQLLRRDLRPGDLLDRKQIAEDLGVSLIPVSDAV